MTTTSRPIKRTRSASRRRRLQACSRPSGIQISAAVGRMTVATAASASAARVRALCCHRGVHGQGSGGPCERGPEGGGGLRPVNGARLRPVAEGRGREHGLDIVGERAWPVVKVEPRDQRQRELRWGGAGPGGEARQGQGPGCTGTHSARPPTDHAQHSAPPARRRAVAPAGTPQGRRPLPAPPAPGAAPRSASARTHPRPSCTPPLQRVSFKRAWLRGRMAIRSSRCARGRRRGRRRRRLRRRRGRRSRGCACATPR